MRQDLLDLDPFSAAPSVPPDVRQFAELTGVVGKLLEDGVPFFGPTRRADGVFQLYVELPYHHYLEIDSLTFNGTVGTPSATAWADVV
mgnify:CR=1 FL=1